MKRYAKPHFELVDERCAKCRGFPGERIQKLNPSEAKTSAQIHEAYMRDDPNKSLYERFLEVKYEGRKK